MMQSQSSFAIFVFGLIALNAAKVSVWVVVFLAVFLPVLLTPLLLRLTIWRDTKAVSLEDLPRFTPETGFCRPSSMRPRKALSCCFCSSFPPAP